MSSEIVSQCSGRPAASFVDAIDTTVLRACTLRETTPYEHSDDPPFAFDPTYGMSLAQLLAIEPPVAPGENFDDFWMRRYRRAIAVDTKPVLSDSSIEHPDRHVRDIVYTSTGSFRIGGLAFSPPRNGERASRPRGRPWLWRPRPAGPRSAGEGHGGAVSLLSRPVAERPSTDPGGSRRPCPLRHRKTR